MPPEYEINLRRYEETDRAQVRSIAVKTAFMGDAGGIFCADEEILADWLTFYYLRFESESSFVAEYKNQKVIGYLLGCIDTKRYQRIFQQNIMPRLILKSLCRGLLFKADTQRFIYYSLRSLARGEFRRPDFSRQYPAHLHINIALEFRKKGIGTQLAEIFLNYLKIKRIKGLHAWTMTEAGKSLFRSLGFALLYNQRVTYFDYILKRELFLSCFGKRIN